MDKYAGDQRRLEQASSREFSGKYQGLDTYLNQDHHMFTKENFKIMGDLLQEKVASGQIPENARVLDVGCATGALVSHLKQRFSNMSFLGIDVSEELLEVAKDKVPNASFLASGVQEVPTKFSEKFDVVLCFGVLGIFDEIEAEDAVLNMLSVTKRNGFAYIFSQFNEYDIDVKIRHRRVEEGLEWQEWGVGWNNYSFQTVLNWVSGKAANVRFIDFNMPVPIEPKENPIRSWTFMTQDGGLKLTNGLKIMIDFRFCEIEV